MEAHLLAGEVLGELEAVAGEAPETLPEGPIYDNYEDMFHRHYESYDEGRYPFERYEIAYTYGFDLAADEPYRDRDWLEIEEEARREWEEEQAGPWENFKEAIQYAWKTAREAMSR